MSIILVPKSVSFTTADLWVASNAPPPKGLSLRYGNRTVGLPDHWFRLHESTDRVQLFHRTARIKDLSPGLGVEVRLLQGSRLLGSARITALPARLPMGGGTFTVMLGSCYCNEKDRNSSVGQTFNRLPANLRPDIKIFAGDQVYLDSPWKHFLIHTHSEREMRERFLTNYWNTWAGSQRREGLRSLLRNGGNYFVADDHEFWNNFPNRAAHIRDTWFSGGRNDWGRVADRLFRAFQTPELFYTIEVPPLSIAMMDTRVGRDSAEKNFCDPGVMHSLEQWVGGLRGAGCLVVGQAAFQKKANRFTGHFTDWVLPNYDQFRSIARILNRSEKPLLVLTGDVHFRRIASTVGDRNPLVEIISSPLTLVDKRAEGGWREAPDRFPDEPVSGISRRHTVTHNAMRGRNDNAFLLLQFSMVQDNAIKLDIFDVPVSRRVNLGQPAWTTRLRSI